MAVKGSNKLKNNSGKMTLSEFKEWMKKFDIDGDGRISKAELRMALCSAGQWYTRWKSARALSRADTNGNGYIDGDEYDKLVGFARDYLGIKIVG